MKLKVLIFDPIGGASGDMILGSLIHLGCPSGYLTDTWDSLGITKEGIKKNLMISEKKINGITAIDVKFSFEEGITGQDVHNEMAVHSRSYEEIKVIIHDSLIPDQVKVHALKIFDHIAQAEAEVHGLVSRDVHFHELGAVDSILDIVGISAALEWFNVQKIFYRPLPLGCGVTRSLHGTIPVPAPATLKLLHDFRVRFTEVRGELTTPTGAGVIKAIAESQVPNSEMEVLGEGYGSGDHDYDGWPNIFRSILCRMNMNVKTEKPTTHIN